MRLLFFFFIIFLLSAFAHTSSAKQLTPEQRAYLKDKKYITFCTQPNSLPYSAIKNSHFIGIGGDILQQISNDYNITFKLIETNVWSESLHKAQNKECDLLPLSVKSPARKKYFNFTSSYYTEPLVLIIKKETNYILSLDSVLDKKFSIEKESSYIDILRMRYPRLQLVEVDDMQEGIVGVEQGKYYAHIDVLMSSAYALQKLSQEDLKISNSLGINIDVAFSVRKDDVMLLSIMEHIAQNLQPSDIQKTLNEWVSIHYASEADYSYLIWVLIIVLLIIFFALYREKILTKKNQEQQVLQDRLSDWNGALESRISDIMHDLEKAQEVAKIGFWVYDIRKDTLKWSAYSYTMFEVTKKDDENLYDILFEHIHPDDVQKVKNTYYESLESKSVYEVNHRILMPDGRIKYVSEKGETKFAEDGTPLVTYGTTQDITQTALLDIELKQKDAFLVHQARLAQMGEMLSMIAHQWKQPLSAISSTQIMIKTALELSKYDLSDVQEREDFVVFLQERLDRIALYVSNLSSTITDFSDFYKPDKLVQKSSLDVLVLKAYNLVKESLLANYVKVSLDLDAKEEVFLHKNEVMQVVLNIIQNAQEQLLEKKIISPTIDIKSYEEEMSIVLEIEDNAGGIKKEIMDKIFDPYFSTKLEKNGTGLGLYMCKMIISEYHGGSIEVQNTTQGALFRIKISKELSE